MILAGDAVGAEPRYRAFLSYSHADAAFAAWLHRKLEATRLPAEKGEAAERLAPVFIDRAELSAATDLSASVRAALAESAALVVIASPAAKASRWVGQEIALFRELYPDRPILAALIEGEPGEAFPAPLVELDGAAIEPLAADFRKVGDGRRLALLKIVAGLSGQPLDRLVQREATARQRRVMAVTAGALVLSVVLATMLAFALSARAEAERQRAEAEGMVEFMLTDLRERLKGVGRLDVMQAVNERAMGYYASQAGLDQLEPDSLQRRARVIGAMGEDDENSGKIEAAQEKYKELHRVTEALLAQEPNNPKRVFAHATSENRLGLIATTRQRLDEAVPHFRTAAAMLNRLPDSLEFAETKSLVEGNLCATGLRTKGAPAVAKAHCENAIRYARQRIGSGQAADDARYDLVFHQMWLGDVHAEAGNRAEADEAHEAALRESETLIAADPENMLWLEQHMEINLRMAARARKTANRQLFRRSLALAKADNQRLVARDSSNKYWNNYKTVLEDMEEEFDNDRY